MPQHLWHALAHQPCLVAPSQPGGTTTGEYAQRELAPTRHQLPRFTCRINRRFFSI